MMLLIVFLFYAPCVLAWRSMFSFSIKPQQGLTSSRSLIQPPALFMANPQMEDEEDLEAYLRITSNYLASKFKYCLGDSKDMKNEGAVRDLLRDVLPPLAPQALETEVENVYQTLSQSSSNAAIDNFVRSVIDNPYWEEVGPFVVKELIYLDCLYHFYYKKASFLNNEEYNELKDSLSWEGSMAANLSAKEALFISAVASHRRGHEILNDKEYETLKQELRAEQSWVVLREQDPLEKMGVSTFMSYLHSAM